MSVSTLKMIIIWIISTGVILWLLPEYWPTITVFAIFALIVVKVAIENLINQTVVEIDHNNNQVDLVDPYFDIV